MSECFGYYVGDSICVSCPFQEECKKAGRDNDFTDPDKEGDLK